MGDQGESNRAIKVKMLMFGPLAEKIGTREIDVSLIEGTSLNDLAMQFELVEMLSSIILPGPKILVNQLPR